MGEEHVRQDMDSAADRLLDKLRRFISAELDPQERAVFAALLAPGVAAAHADHVVAGGGQSWSPVALPEALVAALDRRKVRVEGLGL